MAETGQGVKVLHKSLDVLEALRSRPEGIGLAEVASAAGLPRATAYRILATLEARGYAGRKNAGAYVLAKKLFDQPGEDAIEQLLLKIAPTAMEQLVQNCRETVNLGRLDGGEVLVVHTVESPQSVRMTSKAGNRRYLHTTALGKVLLSGMTDAEIRRLLRVKGLARLTAGSLTDEAAVLAEIGRVRRRGYSVDNQENELDGRCIGAAIRDREGRVIAGLSISVPAFRIDLTRLRALSGPLRESCEAISRSLGA
ncbi:MAG: IclR family transcriptional regulator [Bryobacteraceae bacterium]|nr:IclR family transcriptional regulator [Bryobacteraceae bacterium]